MRERVAPGLLQNLVSVNNHLGRILNTIFKTYPVPMSVPEYTMLWTINDNPDETQYRLGKLTGFTNQRAHQIIRALHDSQLVIKGHKEIGTKTQISITEKGLSALEDIQNGALEILFLGFDDSEFPFFEELNMHLRRFSDTLKENGSIQQFIK